MALRVDCRWLCSLNASRAIYQSKIHGSPNLCLLLCALICHKSGFASIFPPNARDKAKLMLMQKLSFLSLPVRAGVRAGPSCTLRGHSRCRRRTATVAGRPTGVPEWRDAAAFDSLESCDGMSGGSAAATEWRDGLTVNISECFVSVDLASWALTGSLDGSQRAVDGCEWNSGGREWRWAAPRCSAD